MNRKWAIKNITSRLFYLTSIKDDASGNITPENNSRVNVSLPSCVDYNLLQKNYLCLILFVFCFIKTLRSNFTNQNYILS